MKVSIQWQRWLPLMILVFLSAIFAVQNEAFLTARNLTNLARQVSVNAVLASGMTLVILLGAIDLSVGSLLALAAVVGALVQTMGGSLDTSLTGAFVSIIAVMLTSMSFTACTGYLVPKFRIPPFVVTLGFLVSARGLALALSNGSRIGPLSDSYRWIGTAFIPNFWSLVLIVTAGLIFLVPTLLRPTEWPQKIGRALGIVALCFGLATIFYSYQGLPIPVVVMAAVIGLVWFILEKTVLGRWIYAVGGNPEAARLCGLPVRTVFMAVYLLLGFFVGIAALIDSGRIDAGDPNGGNLYELDAIAAVVIGGTSLQGGVGTIGGTLLGALLIGVLNNSLSLMNVENNRQMILKGLIIIVAVWLDVVARHRRK